ncbi:MAG: acyltransferase [Deltaproteobacteria bacterium]|nr:acyltransferase [Deltaproteobacteria bacterium]
MTFLDLLRALASQTIVWHHFVIYGPLPVAAAALAPMVFDVLDAYGRMAVQVFFVVGGFLTARGLTSARPPSLRAFGSFLAHRYRRTGIPAFAAVLITVTASALARRWTSDPGLITSPPTLDQLAAHAFFVNYLVGYEALTPGIWYLAIDFQLGIVALLIFWAGGLIARELRRRWASIMGLGVARVLFAALAIASLLVFNRDPRLDIWAIYFFGSYFLGMILYWAVCRLLSPLWLWAYLALVIGAACWDWRPRLLLASATALSILAMAQLGMLERWPSSRIAAFLGRISFSLFLLHFPVVMMVNAWFEHRDLLSPGPALAGLLLAYAIAIVAATGFHNAIELPAASGRFPFGPRAPRVVPERS